MPHVSVRNGTHSFQVSSGRIVTLHTVPHVKNLVILCSALIVALQLCLSRLLLIWRTIVKNWLIRASERCSKDTRSLLTGSRRHRISKLVSGSSCVSHRRKVVVTGSSRDLSMVLIGLSTTRIQTSWSPKFTSRQKGLFVYTSPGFADAPRDFQRATTGTVDAEGVQDAPLSG